MSGIVISPAACDIRSVQYYYPAKFKKEVSISASVPIHLKHLAIRFATCQYTTGGFGEYITQEYAWNGLAFDYSQFFIRQQVVLYPTTRQPELDLQFMLKGNLTARLKGFPDQILLKQSVYRLFYVPPGRNEAVFPPGEYISFYIRIAPQWLKQLAKKYKQLNEFIHRARRKEMAGLPFHSARITASTRKIIKEIIHCREPSPEREIFFESRIKTLLLQYARQLSVIDAGETFKRTNDKMVPLLKSYIENNLASKLTVSLIAEKSGRSETMLKKIFKQLFGTSIRQYIIHVRLNKVKELYAQHVPLESIVIQTGFNDHSHLLRMYKKHRGIPLHATRKRNGKHL